MNAQTPFIIIMERLVFNVSIQNTIIITKTNAWNAPKTKSIISNSNSVYLVLRSILILMELDVQFALKTQFGILLQNNVKLVKEDRT